MKQLVMEWLEELKTNNYWKSQKAQESIIDVRKKRLEMLAELRRTSVKKAYETLFCYYYNMRLAYPEEKAADATRNFMERYFAGNSEALEEIMQATEQHMKDDRGRVHLLADQNMVHLLDISDDEVERTEIDKKRRKTEQGYENRKLDDSRDYEIAQMKFLGYSKDVIAEKVGCSIRTIYRVFKRLKLDEAKSIYEVNFADNYKYKHSKPSESRTEKRMLRVDETDTKKEKRQQTNYEEQITPEWFIERKYGWVSKFKIALGRKKVRGYKGMYDFLTRVLCGQCQYQKLTIECLAEVASICISQPMYQTDTNGNTYYNSIVLNLVKNVQSANERGEKALQQWMEEHGDTESCYVIYPDGYHPYEKDIKSVIEETKLNQATVIRYSHYLHELKRDYNSFFYAKNGTRLRREVFFERLDKRLSPEWLCSLPCEAQIDSTSFEHAVVESLCSFNTEKRVRLSSEQKKALKKLQKGGNVFITGGAGVGKSVLLKAFIEWAEEAGKNVLVTAPTGIAAEHVNGITLNRALKMKCGYLSKGERIRKINRLTYVDVLVIDEISMCRIDQFAYVIKKMLHSNPKTQIVLCGDFFQLPPVADKTENELIEQEWGKGKRYAFQSGEWDKLNLTYVNLKEVHRQKNKDYVDALNKIRVGDTSCIDWINANASMEVDNNAKTIATTNKDVNEINERYILNNSGNRLCKPLNCQYMDGRICSDSIITKADLFLFEGMHVMFTQNDNREWKYQNGTTGIVSQIKANKIYVRLSGGREIPVTRVRHSGYEYIRQDFGGWIKDSYQKGQQITYMQFPLTPCYAYTSNKSQGQSLSKINVIPDTFSHGQLYVQLSRCKDIENLHLTKALFQENVYVDEVVKEFYEKIEN